MDDKHSNSYGERISALNVAEARFEFFCEGKNIWHTRMGFDETNNTVPLFYKIHPFIRSLPDYLMRIGNKLYYVHVKGTNKLKMFDLGQYTEFDELYCTPETSLVLAFCFEDGGTPIFRNIKRINKWVYDMMEKGTLDIKKFPSDGKEYIEIPL